MLIVFPIGLWIFSLVCDFIYHAGSHNVFWKGVAFYTMLAGVIGVLLTPFQVLLTTSRFGVRALRELQPPI